MGQKWDKKMDKIGTKKWTKMGQKWDIKMGQKNGQKWDKRMDKNGAKWDKNGAILKHLLSYHTLNKKLRI